MSMLLLALAQAAAQPTPPLARDWSTLPRIPLNNGTRMTVEDVNAVKELAQREECRASVGPVLSATSGDGDRMWGLRMDLAVLVAPDGSFLAIRAAPGACDAIRNYARAVINGRFRGHVRGPAGPGPAWYGTTLNFAWNP